jgi:hypothetical protein
MSARWWYLSLRKALQGQRPPVPKQVIRPVPRDVGRNLPPRRVPNKTVRTREYLTPAEVAVLIDRVPRSGTRSHGLCSTRAGDARLKTIHRLVPYAIRCYFWQHHVACRRNTTRRRIVLVRAQHNMQGTV